MSASNDFNDIKDAFKEAFSGVGAIARDFAATAGDKAKSLGRMAKLTMDVNAERDSLKKAYAEIGKLCYETYKDNPGDFFIQLFDEVKLSEANLSSLEAELDALRQSVGDVAEDPIIDPAAAFEDAVEQDETTGIEVEITEEPPKE